MELLEKLNAYLWERANEYEDAAKRYMPADLETRDLSDEEDAIYMYGYYAGKFHGYEEAAEKVEEMIGRVELAVLSKEEEKE